VKHLVVIGGGISGTAAAATARKRAGALGLDLHVVLLEKDAEIGGKARSLREADWLFEMGPIGYLNSEPVVDELVRDAGLESELISARAAQSHRFVHSRGRVREVKATPLGFVTSGLVSVPGLLRAAREPWIPGKKDSADESVWDFAARRLGPEFADRLIHPMVLGIFAGDAKRLSLSAAFPIMAELERDHGSLVRAQIARARARKRGELPPRRSTLCSFPNGIQSLPRALASRGGFEVRTGTTVEAVTRREQGGFRVSIAGAGESLSADAVILASEGYRSAALLEELVPKVSRALLEIPYPPVYVVALGYGPEARERIPEGFGVLLPRDAGYRALGVTWDGYLFPRRSGEGRLLVRVLFGGSFDPDVEALEPAEIVETAKKEMSKLFGLEREPLFTRAKLWNRAIPQYELGHGERARRIEEELRGIPGLYLAGNALHGTAFGKAAARGALCGERAVDYVAGPAQPRRSR
jgi:protoporphyrinogen/coproporphyrinogen III oxidase